MLTETLQRKLDRYASADPLGFERFSRGFTLPGLFDKPVAGPAGTSLAEIEAFRERIGGVFGHRTGRRWFRRNLASAVTRVRDGFLRGEWVWEATSEWSLAHNIVTNEGIAHAAGVLFQEASDIAPWYVVTYTDSGTPTPAAGDTYATPNFVEADGDDLDETVRQAWVDGSQTGTTTVSVPGGAVTYTGDASFNAQGAAFLGAGSAATTLGDTAGGGTLYAASDFSSPVAMTLDATLDITYTQQVSDDGA